MEKIKDSFGLLIAFIVPGMLGLLLLEKYIPDIHRGLVYAKEIDGSILLLILASLGIGMIVFSYWAILFRVGCYLLKYQPLSAQHMAKLDKDRLELQGKAFDSTFRYYQFYGNMFLVLFAYSLMSAIEFIINNESPAPPVIAFVSAICCLPIAFHSYDNYKTRVLEIINYPTAPTPTSKVNTDG